MRLAKVFRQMKWLTQSFAQGLFDAFTDHSGTTRDRFPIKQRFGPGTVKAGAFARRFPVTVAGQAAIRMADEHFRRPFKQVSEVEFPNRGWGDRDENRHSDPARRRYSRALRQGSPTRLNESPSMPGVSDVAIKPLTTSRTSTNGNLLLPPPPIFGRWYCTTTCRLPNGGGEPASNDYSRPHDHQWQALAAMHAEQNFLGSSFGAGIEVAARQPRIERRGFGNGAARPRHSRSR